MVYKLQCATPPLTHLNGASQKFIMAAVASLTMQLPCSRLTLPTSVTMAMTGGRCCGPFSVTTRLRGTHAEGKKMRPGRPGDHGKSTRNRCAARCAHDRRSSWIPKRSQRQRCCQC